MDHESMNPDDFLTIKIFLCNLTTKNLFLSFLAKSENQSFFHFFPRDLADFFCYFYLFTDYLYYYTR